ncbi:MAG: 6-phospho-beta-glucosidase [Clostridiaceae bacterium]|nr:6-phospho-beta-glucosidase [Clostridiaceae bacterium]
MKITIIGAGSSYTPELIEGLIARCDSLRVDEIALVDIESGRYKLEIIEAFSKRMITRSGLEIRISSGMDRKAALTGSSYVITQIRVGGLAAREIDEKIPTEYGVLGQETTGAGGMAKALRTIPVILDIAHEMEALCPQAWLINFTNPSGIVTEAVHKYSDIHCLGLCNAPMNMQRTLAANLKLGPEDVAVKYIGLNHLSWISRIWVRGQDLTDELFAQQNFIDQVASILGDEPVNKKIVSGNKLIPSYYLKYFYHPARQIRDDKQALADGSGTRAVQVEHVEKELFELYALETTDTKPEQLSKRGGAWYSEAALSLIESLESTTGGMHIVNVLNQGAISDLPTACVVETNCFVDRSGVRPLAAGALPAEISGFVHTIKGYEQLVIEAAVRGSRDHALAAMLLNPLIADADIAQPLLDALLEAHKLYLPAFF